MLFHSLIFLLIISKIQLQPLLASAELDACCGAARFIPLCFHCKNSDRVLAITGGYRCFGIPAPRHRREKMTKIPVKFSATEMCLQAQVLEINKGLLCLLFIFF